MCLHRRRQTVSHFVGQSYDVVNQTVSIQYCLLCIAVSELRLCLMQVSNAWASPTIRFCAEPCGFLCILLTSQVTLACGLVLSAVLFSWSRSSPPKIPMLAP